LNSRLHNVHTAAAGMVPSHFRTRRLRFGMARFDAPQG
jgi:hypothetical protein